MVKTIVVEEFKNLIAESGISQKSIAAKHLDITPQYLSQVLNGECEPSDKLLKKIIKLRDKLKNSGLIGA